MLSAAVRLTWLPDGTDDGDAAEARARLADAQRLVDNLIARGHRWMRWGLDVLATGLAVWAVAALSGQAIGLGAGWTVTLAIVATGVVPWTTLAFHPVTSRVLERRRARRANVGDVWVPPGTSAVAELLGLLRLARTALVEAAAEPRRAGGFGGLLRVTADYGWLHDSRQRDRWIRTGERRLCQAIAATERWQATVRDAR